MGSCDQQYRNHYLYIYSDSRTMCDHSNTHHHCEPERAADICCRRSLLFRSSNPCTAYNFDQWHHWYLGSCNQQYRNNYLYIYSDSRTVRNHSNAHHHCEPERAADICCRRSLLFRSSNPCTAYNFDQWHHRNMGSCHQQYRNNNLYIYSDSRTVCNHSNTHHHCEPERAANICCRGSLLFRCSDPCPANNIYQWYHWYLGSCDQQYRDHYLYIYSDSRTVRNHSHTYHHCESECTANICCRRSLLFWCSDPCPAYNFDQWYHRYLGSCDQQYRNHYLYVYSDSRTVRYHSNTDHYC